MRSMESDLENTLGCIGGLIGCFGTAAYFLYKCHQADAVGDWSARECYGALAVVGSFVVAIGGVNVGNLIGGIIDSIRK